MSLPEEWRPIPGYEGAYEASSIGRIRSLDRPVTYTRGPKSYQMQRKGKMLTRFTYASGHVYVRLGGRQESVHSLVLLTFVGPRPFPGWESRHLNGDPGDNRLANLAWGTRAENTLDRVRHGTHNQTRKTHCKWGHEFTPENTKPNQSGPHTRACVECGRRWSREYQRKKKAALAAALNGGR